MDGTAPQTVETPALGRRLTITETVSHLGLSRAMVYKLMADGELGSVKVGKSRRVPEHELARFMADHEAGRQ